MNYHIIPECGNVPENRNISQQRKKVKLFSLAREINAMAEDGDCIVDFVS